MKNHLCILGVILLLTVTSLSQDHAPTVEQCQADQSLWWEQFDTSEKMSKLGAQQLHDRTREMQDCSAVDKPHRDSYTRLASLFLLELEQRFANFIARRGLTDEFMAEDAAGKR